MQNICSRATIVFLILFSTSDVFAASLQTVGECGKQTAMTKNGALLVGYPFCAADIACALQEPIGASALCHILWSYGFHAPRVCGVGAFHMA